MLNDEGQGQLKALTLTVVSSLKGQMGSTNPHDRRPGFELSSSRKDGILESDDLSPSPTRDVNKVLHLDHVKCSGVAPSCRNYAYHLCVITFQLSFLLDFRGLGQESAESRRPDNNTLPILYIRPQDHFAYKGNRTPRAAPRGRGPGEVVDHQQSERQRPRF